VRRIVYDLRPPVLDQLGLVAAIKQHAERAGGEGLQIEVIAPEALPVLDAAVEVAAYRIVLEAITNVVHHGGANHCEINLRVDGELVLEIIDNGCGIPPNVRPGVGLRSMRERAAEVGGSFAAAKMAAGGTSVRVSLPLATKAT
jgi:two-component system NarL family sensor kinase